MALYKSHLVTQASGSVGGTTYAHTGSGLYMRARSIPVNPNTGNQLEVRAAMTNLVNAWTNILTPAQRNAWDLYGANVPVTNALGDTINLSGQNWYIACNVPRLQAVSKLGTTIARVNAAPVIFDRGDFTTPVPTIDVSSGISTAYTNTDTWAAAVENVLLIYEGRPANASRNYFKGPFRLIDSVEGAVVPPTSPEVTTPAEVAARGFVYAAGQNVWTKFVVSRADGRLSTPRIVGPDLAVA